jgi:hypothetical protein
VTQPSDAPGTVRGFFASARERVRGAALVVLGLPLLFEGLFELAAGRLPQALAAAGGGALLLVALGRVRRRDRRSVWQGAAMVGLAAAIVASVGADYGFGISLVFAAAAAFGTALAYGPAKETVLPQVQLPDLRPPPPEPPPPEPPPSDPQAAALARLQARMTALAAAPVTLPRGAFADAIARIAGTGVALLDEARSDPVDFARVRGFLDLYLDQIETLVLRHGQAVPAGGPMPEGLAGVLGDLEQAFAAKLAELRAHDVRALDVEVEALARRLAAHLNRDAEPVGVRADPPQDRPPQHQPPH